MKPHLISQVTDADGNVLQDWKPESFKVVSPYVASQMQDMMRSSSDGRHCRLDHGQ